MVAAEDIRMEVPRVRNSTRRQCSMPTATLIYVQTLESASMHLNSALALTLHLSWGVSCQMVDMYVFPSLLVTALQTSTMIHKQISRLMPKTTIYEIVDGSTELGGMKNSKSRSIIIYKYMYKYMCNYMYKYKPVLSHLSLLFCLLL